MTQTFPSDPAQAALDQLRVKIAEAQDIIKYLADLHVGLYFYHGDHHIDCFPNQVSGKITTVRKLK